MQSSYEIGHTLLMEKYEEGIKGVIDGLRDIAPHISRYIVEFFGSGFTNPVLDERQRELITISALTALGDCPNQLNWHINFGLNVGLTPNEIIEALTHCIPFCGFPRALNAVTIAKQVFAARQLEVNVEDELKHADGRRARGLDKLREIDGEHGAEVVSALEEVAPALGSQIVELTFGEIYSRSGLSARQRQLVTLAALTALGGCEPQLHIHLHAAVRVGLSKQEVLEALLQCWPYAGFPKVLNAVKAARETVLAT